MARMKCLSSFVLALLTVAHAQVKLGQTGFQFLSVAADARGGAMGSAMTAMRMNSSSLFFNPAGMARAEGVFDVTASQNNWIAEIKHNAYSAAIKLYGGRYGVLGFTLMSVDYGKVQGTMVWQNEKGYVDTETLHPLAFAAGLGYAKSLTDKFVVGGHVKYAGQQLGKSLRPIGDSLAIKKNLAFATAFDFGTLYRTGYKSLVFGMSVRNFSRETTFAKESFQLPLTFSLGLAMNLFDFWGGVMNKQALWISIDALHPRSYPEQLNVGFEYQFYETLILRSGYLFNSDEQTVSFGFGIHKYGVGIDYAFIPFGVFGNVQRITVRFSLAE